MRVIQFKQVFSLRFLETFFSSISTQHIPTLFAQHLQPPAKRSQQLNATDRNLVGRNMLHAFGHLVQHLAACCELKIKLVRMPRRNIVARTWPKDCNIMRHPQMLHEKFDQQHLTCRNRSQQGGQTGATF